MSDADAEPPTPPPVYVHKLGDHGVQGDGTFREINDHDRPYEGGKEGAMNMPDLGQFLEAAEEKKKDEPDNTPLEPLPEIPKMPMTVDQAYEFLGVKKEDHGNLEKVKLRFRKMSLKWHPDKNLKRPTEAAEIFKAVHASYHFLTTNNFDYKRWAESFVIPPMQTLEDVLVMALKGADPYQIEMLLKKRGDYRPHQDFGVNLSIPWSAGTKEAPSYHVHTGSAYTTTQGLEDKQRRELGYSGGASVNDGAIVTTTAGMDTSDLLEKFGKKAQVGADTESRPWEMVGGVGFDQKKKERAPLYVPPKTRPELTAASPEALTVAEEYNDRAVKAFKEKEWQRCYDEASEAIRLNPRKKEYLSNRSAAGLKLKGKRYQRQAAEDSVTAYELDPQYKIAFKRAAQAHLALNEKATVKLAVQELQQALALDEDDAKTKELLRDAQLTWEADFED